MVEGWRSRYMAPIYALIFSFLLVFVLGAALNRSVGLVELVVDGADSGALSSVTAEVSVEDGTTSPGQTFPFEVPDGSFDVCVVLPSGWVAATDRAVDGGAKGTCWLDLRPGDGNVGLRVKKKVQENKTRRPCVGVGWCADK